MIALIVTAALKSTVLLSLAWLSTALLRRASADLRHRIWLAAFFGCALLLIPAPVPETAQLVTLTYTVASDVATRASQSTPLLPIVWTIGAALLVLRLVGGTLHLALLTRRSQPTEDPSVRISKDIASPLTWGVAPPVVLLPAYSSEWTPAKRAIALAHERAHIARADWFWQTFSQLMTAVFWFNPFAWIAAARLRQEAEHAVDDAVLASGAEAVGYAEQLLDVARHVHGVSLVAAVAMVRRPALTSRVTAILDSTRTRARAGLRSRVAIALAALALVPLLAAFQSSPAPTAPSAAVAPGFTDPVGSYPVNAPPEPSEVAQQAPPPPPPPPPVPSQALPVGDGVTAPIPIYKVNPSYPQEAKDAKVEGEVMLSVVIDEAGSPAEISVLKGVGAGLDEQAIAAVQQWRFQPGMKDGQPVRVRATIAINFKLL